MIPGTIEELRPQTEAAWRALRRVDVTASQAGGLIPGVHPYHSPYSLFVEKTGRLPPDNTDSPVRRRGRLLEPIAVQMTAEHFPGAQIEHNAAHRYWRDPAARIGATPDLIVTDKDRGRGVVQLKAIEPSIYARTWFEGEPPLWIAIQAITEAKLTGADFAAVGVLRVGWQVDFDVIPIPIHAGTWERIKAEAAAFWERVATDDAPDPDYDRDAATIRALTIEATPGASIDLSGDKDFCAAVIERERLKRAASDFKQRTDHLEALIRHKVGAHEMAIAGDYRVTIKPEQVAGYTVKPSTRRPLRVKSLVTPIKPKNPEADL